MDVLTPSGPESDTPVAPDSSTPAWVGRLVVGVAAVLIAAIGIVAALGGFEQRADHLQLAPGTEIDANNLVFSLEHATAQRTSSGSWTVVVSGQVRNPHPEPLAPIVGDYGNLVVRPAVHTQAAVVSAFALGGTWRRAYVPPTNRPIPFEATFTLDGQDQLGDTMDCAVFSMEYTDPTILGLGSGPYWNVDSYARVQYATLPLTVLPQQ
ncbi:MAG: hypothetical protein LWW77_05045 [Propionibacteriales bacterium]|nr:hypothetical protein [Propionibacteriales bacterium]